LRRRGMSNPKPMSEEELQKLPEQLLHTAVRPWAADMLRRLHKTVRDRERQRDEAWAERDAAIKERDEAIATAQRLFTLYITS